MADEPLQLQYTLTLNDLVNIADHRWRTVRVHRLHARIMSVLVCIPILSAAVVILASDGWQSSIAVFLVAFAALVFIPWLLKVRLRTAYRQMFTKVPSGVYDGPRMLTIDGDRVTFAGEKVIDTVHLSLLKPIYRAPDAIYLHLGGGACFVVPRRDLTDEQCEALLARFPQHVLHDDKGRMLKLHADANQVLEGMSDEQMLRQYLYRYNPRCPACGYGLFRLQSPTCPECGTPLWLTVTSVMPGGLTFMGQWLALILALTVASTAGVLLTLMMVVTGRLFYGGPLHGLTAAFLLLTPIPTVVFATMHPLRSRDSDRWKAIRVMTVFLLLMIVGAIIAMGTLYMADSAGVTP